jgi:hypothetical protein
MLKKEYSNNEINRIKNGKVSSSRERVFLLETSKNRQVLFIALEYLAEKNTSL